MTKTDLENDNSTPEHTESVAEKLLLSFNDQFSTNQNHHQSVFLQFLSAILIVLIGYGFVYVNTGSNSEIFTLKHVGDQPIYAAFHLAGTYSISQFILTLLATVVVNIGYGFRRDQKVIYKIRTRYLSKADYINFFGKASFRPFNQSFFDYLPEFNRMFFWGIYLLQLLLLLSFGIKLEQIDLYSGMSSLRWLYYMIYVFPFAWNTWLYCNYYKKYYRVMHDNNEKWTKIFFGKTKLIEEE